MDPQSAPKPPSFRVFAAVLVAGVALTIGLSSATRKAVFSGLADRTIVVRQSAGGWEALPAPAAGAERVRVSEGGVVWVATAFQGGLSRLEGNSWHAFTGSDFGTKSCS